jgi:hypothetical protein
MHRALNSARFVLNHVVADAFVRHAPDECVRGYMNLGEQFNAILTSTIHEGHL